MGFSGDEILLEREQKVLLCKIVEAHRNVPPNRRQDFWFGRYSEGDIISHPGFRSAEDCKTFVGDVQALLNAGLLDLLNHGSNGDFYFVVSPLGFRYYEWLETKDGEPVRQLESSVRSFLDDEAFRRLNPGAFGKWEKAEQLLWASDSQEQLSTIGHHCRESMQEFASELIDRYQPSNVDPDKKHDVARIKAVLQQRGARLGKTELPFLDALVAYWGTLSDLVQRQEHGGQREGEPLVWEDGRRVVFQTAVVMFEVSRSLSNTAGH